MKAASLMSNALWQDSISQSPRPLTGLSANRTARGPQGCVSLARFQDLALAHWTHSAGKDAVQRGIYHLQHRLLLPRFISSHQTVLERRGSKTQWGGMTEQRINMGIFILRTFKNRFININITLQTLILCRKHFVHLLARKWGHIRK